MWAGPRAGREEGILGVFHGTFGQHLHKGALGGVPMNSPGFIAWLLNRKARGLLDAGRERLFPAHLARKTPTYPLFFGR